MTERIGTVVYKDTPDARSRFAELGLNTDFEDTFRITLNGTDTNGDVVTPRFVQIDNFENIAPVVVTINGIKNSIAPYTRTTFEIGGYTPEIGIVAYEGLVKIYISETKLGIGDGTNDLAKDSAFNMGTYYNRDGSQPLIAELDLGDNGFRNAKSKGLVSTAIAFTAAFTGAGVRDGRDKLQDYVTIKDFNVTGDGVADDTAKIQAAIDSGAKQIAINAVCGVSSTINLKSDQTIIFNGGSLVALAGFNGANGILYAENKENLNIYNPSIDASATAGVVGINMIGCVNITIDGGRLKKCNVQIQSYQPEIARLITVSDLLIEMMNYGATAVYVSGVRDVTFKSVTCSKGGEGFGVYNGAQKIRFIGCTAFGHVRDGFVVIAGTEISHHGCDAYSNGQSGFTTQRQTAAQNTIDISYVACIANENQYDGFDIRGKNDAPAYGVDTRYRLGACSARGNVGTGFYVVLAEGTTLDNCVAIGNTLAGLRVDTSDRTIVSGFRSISNASGLAAGVTKAGIDVYNSSNCQFIGCVSTNSNGAVQQFGISFNGNSVGGRVLGGDYTNNTDPKLIYLGSQANIGGTGTSGNAFVGGLADISGAAGAFLISISQRGTFEEEGFGIPGTSFALARPRDSIFKRLDGGGAELYICNGGNSWRAV